MNHDHPSTATPDNGARITGSGFSDHSGPGPELLTASTLTGDAVLNHNGDTLGKISEIMLDVQGGRVAYAVMASGGFLGMGNKLFAIPWGALEVDSNRKCFVLDANKERFDDAPGFDKDSWPSVANDAQWHRAVHAHYHAQRNFWD